MRIFLIILLVFSCSENPIQKGNETDKLKVNYSIVRSATETTVDLVWECSSASYGILTYGNIGFENTQILFFKQKIQYYKLVNLASGKTHNYQVGCFDERKAVYIPQKFTTKSVPIPQVVMNRGIWILGGVGSTNTPVS